MREKKLTGMRFQLCLAAAALLLGLSCDNEHNVNAGNLVTVGGYVFQSRTQRVGVSDVTVVIEKGEESSTANTIPDQFVRTDENGHWSIQFTLSYVDGTGSVVGITPGYIEESMRIVMFSSESRMYDLGAGFTFQVGKTYNIWDVFLEDFTAVEIKE
ncbi:MAG: hypothetical protein U9P14_09915 [Gemmatimonadota bacterium]|nr:hypothetical protein [Gemmatimonadota bacterium]